MINTRTSVKQLIGVGDAVAAKLEVLGIKDVEDLLYNYPRRYEDFTRPRNIANIEPNARQIIKAKIVSVENEVSPRKRMKLTKAVVEDQTGQLDILWFNQPYLISLLKEDSEWLFAGTVERGYTKQLTMISPVIERQACIVPIYPETAGLTSKMIRKLYAQLRPTIIHLEDWLTEPIRNKYGLVKISDALEFIHFPESIEQLSTAKKRLAFDELFFILLGVWQTKRELSSAAAPPCKTPTDKMKQFINKLPFTLTDSQTTALKEILEDLSRPSPMNRLLEGDVGSGKTVVGAGAVLAVVTAGLQVVWMAPTEILANQHYESCQRLLEGFEVKIGLLTGATSAKMNSQINNFDLIIGTQAVIQDKVKFDRLGLIIVDEQHRFGVKQRARLLSHTDLTPHFLAMTATPIPRTLALTIYGELDISALETLPSGRLPIISRFVAPSDRPQAYDFIRRQIEAGRQAFVVCPLIEATEIQEGQFDLGLEEKKAVLAEYAKLKTKIFPKFKVGLLHGKLKSSEKAAVMAEFTAGRIDILVSTAVIEVGIDIPNASVMMIEGAERFGLAQLHQFRGRVGRGEHQSYCFVFSDSSTDATKERLLAFTRTTSGFDLAELDLRLRGPGQLAGLVQSGLGDLKLASLSDIDLIKQAKTAVATLAGPPDRGEGLAENSPLQKRLAQKSETHLN